MPPFHGERMTNYGQTMVEVTQDVISQWQIGQTICVRDYTQEISLRVILRTIFGIDRGDTIALKAFWSIFSISLTRH